MKKNITFTKKKYSHFNTDINECKTNPCKHGASCMDKVNDYMCVCKPGYNGKNCEIGNIFINIGFSYNRNCTLFIE